MIQYEFTRDEVTNILKEHLKKAQNKDIGDAVAMGDVYGAVTLIPVEGAKVHNYSLSNSDVDEIPELTIQEIPNAVTNDGTEKERLINWAINNKELLKIQYQVPQLSSSICLVVEPMYHENKPRRNPSIAARVYMIINGKHVTYPPVEESIKSFQLIRMEKVIAVHAKE